MDCIFPIADSDVPRGEDVASEPPWAVDAIRASWSMTLPTPLGPTFSYNCALLVGKKHDYLGSSANIAPFEFVRYNGRGNCVKTFWKYC